MIEPWFERGIGVAAIEVARRYTADEATNHQTKGQTKHDAFHATLLNVETSPLISKQCSCRNLSAALYESPRSDKRTPN
jgi:hypothetical protein